MWKRQDEMEVEVEERLGFISCITREKRENLWGGKKMNGDE